jgi:hypothetical protein
MKKGCSDRDIIQALKKEGSINKNCRFSSFFIDGDDELHIEYNTQKISTYPLLTLRKKEK